jgi:AmmeMemoRadiSam system protein A
MARTDAASPAVFGLDAAARSGLLALARRALSAAVSHVEVPEPDASGPRAAVFVTWTVDGHLRGCIGTTEPTEPIARAVVRYAIAAGLEDPRFPPIDAIELAAARCEISVLGPLEPVAAPEEIVIGRHGVVVEMRGRRALLLPHVATEWGWDRDEFLSHTCMKAGLPADAWRHGAALQRFETIVFGEE